MTAAICSSLAPTFFGAVADRPSDDVLADYLSFLDRRNGSVASEGALPHREAWLAAADAAPVRFRGQLDPAAFEAGFARATVDPGASLPLVALLSFVKVNAGEAYGVEVVRRHRHRRPVSSRFEQVERILANEEGYHTRILLGAAHQFGLPPPASAWRPPLPLKLLIGALAHSPKALFHPLLLASEVSGVYMFDWMLQRVGQLFGDQPALRETLEARLIEILVDELGHVAFNRLAVGPWGMAAAQRLAPAVAESTRKMTPELTALGWTRQTTGAFAQFGFRSLPEEVRRRAFFV